MASTHGGSLGREKENIAPEKNSFGWLSTRKYVKETSMIVRFTYEFIFFIIIGRLSASGNQQGNVLTKAITIAILKYFSNDFIVNSIGSINFLKTITEFNIVQKTESLTRNT